MKLKMHWNLLIVNMNIVTLLQNRERPKTQEASVHVMVASLRHQMKIWLGSQAGNELFMRCLDLGSIMKRGTDCKVWIHSKHDQS